MFQCIATVPGRISHVEDDIGNRVVVELPELLRQFDTPLADGAMSFERQVSFVVQILLEQAAVVLPAAGDDTLDGPEAFREARILLVRRTSITATGQRGAVPYGALEQRECAIDASVWSGHTGDRDVDGFDAPHIMPGEIDIEQRLWN